MTSLTIKDGDLSVTFTDSQLVQSLIPYDKDKNGLLTPDDFPLECIESDQTNCRHELWNVVGKTLEQKGTLTSSQAQNLFLFASTYNTIKRFYDLTSNCNAGVKSDTCWESQVVKTTFWHFKRFDSENWNKTILPFLKSQQLSQKQLTITVFQLYSVVHYMSNSTPQASGPNFLTDNTCGGIDSFTYDALSIPSPFLRSTLEMTKWYDVSKKWIRKIQADYLQCEDANCQAGPNEMIQPNTFTLRVGTKALETTIKCDNNGPLP